MRNLGLIFSGSLITIIGIGHIFFPTYGYDQDVQSFFYKSPLIADHFYYLATYAICSFILFIGITTIYLGSSKKLAANPEFIRYFIALSILLWGARLLMELKYPVKLSLYGIPSPTKNLVIVLSLIVTGFVAGLVKTFKTRI